MDNKNDILDKIHEILFDMLCAIDDYCKANDIQYCLSGGTCIGAVRHNGFVPWDDDADLIMPRPDFERFVKGFNMAYPGKYEVASLSTDPEWIREAAQVWDCDTLMIMTNIKERPKGVFLDIFPMDGLPEQKWKRKLYYKKLMFYNVLRNARVRTGFYSTEKHVFFKRVLGCLVKPLSARKLTEHITKCALKYDYASSKYVGASLAIQYGDRETQLAENMNRTVDMLFNGRYFPVPVGYHEYLTGLYGDYMKAPDDVEVTGSHHLEGHEYYFDRESFPEEYK